MLTVRLICTSVRDNRDKNKHCETMNMELKIKEIQMCDRLVLPGREDFMEAL